MENEKLPYVAPVMSSVEMETCDLICQSVSGPKPGETVGPGVVSQTYDVWDSNVLENNEEINN